MSTEDGFASSWETPAEPERQPSAPRGVTLAPWELPAPDVEPSVTWAPTWSGTEPPPTGAGPRRRRQQERARRRRRGRVSLVVGVVLVALVAGLLVAVHGHRRHPVVAAPVRTQRTVLLGIGASGEPAQSIALFALDGGGSGRPTGGTLLIPAGTLVDGPGGTVGGSSTIIPSAEFAGSVSDLLGVRVDDTWRLTPAGLASLVDQLGGIPLDVDTTIETTSLALSAGQQSLNGQQAAAYALYGADTEQALANRTRLVLDAILGKLPSQGALAGMLGALGVNSTSSETPAQLATYLRGLAGSTDADNEQVLPVDTLDTGSATPSFSYDRTSAGPIVSQLFVGSLLSGNGAAGTLVEVINDSGRPDLATGARAQLSGAGLTFVRAINDQPFHQYKQTSILVFDNTDASIAFGHKVAAALGLPNAPVLISAQSSSVADALAVLADDYRG